MPYIDNENKFCYSKIELNNLSIIFGKKFFPQIIM